MEPIKKDSILKYIFLNVITVGIYHIMFMNKMGKYTNEICYGDGKAVRSYICARVLANVLSTTGVLGLFITSKALGLLLFALPFVVYIKYWYFMIGQRMKEKAPDYGFKVTESGMDILILSLLPLGEYVFIPTILVNNMNKFARVFNKGLKG
ncbi:MAG: DUF4234 domain-containing protein [Clostridiales bacterium]|nr:DUF4234 domain-containing protein [Clostridiales bacterium]